MPKIDPKTLTIMIVDDEIFIRRLALRLLGDLNYHNIIEAHDGDDALYKLIDAGGVDLILLDLKMPKLDGFGFLERLRTSPNEKLKNIPVIIMTGFGNEVAMKKAARHGIHGFIVKPFPKIAIEKQINHALSHPPIDPTVFGIKPE